MNKSDLKDGMTLIYRNGCKVDYYKGYTVDFESEGIMKMDLFNDDLTHKEHDFWDVCKIIKDDSVVWEREQEIDWSKIPLGTKVIVSNDAFFTEKAMYFISKNGDYYFVVDKKRINADYFKYCKLVEEQKEEVTYNEMMKSIDKICDKNYKKNKTCCGCIAFNSDGLCNRSVIADDSFTITRK